LTELHLVSPADFPSDTATARAAGAADVLGTAIVHRNLQSAVAECGLIVGTTARNRELPWRIDEPRSAASELVQIAEVGAAVVVANGVGFEPQPINLRGDASVAWDDYSGPLKFVAK